MDVDDRRDDELLTTAGIPGWLKVLVATVAVVLFGGVLAVKLAAGSSSPTPAALPSATPRSSTPAPRPTTSVAPALPSSVAAVKLPFRGPPTAIVADGPRLYAVVDGSVVLRTGGSTRSVPISGAAPEYSYHARLVLDAPYHLLWVIVPQDSGVLLRLLDARDLSPRFVVPWPREITAVTAMDGALWLLGPSGVYRFPSGGPTAQQVPLPHGLAVDLAGDPLRHRVLVLLRAGTTTWIGAVHADGRSVFAQAPATMYNGMLAVTGSGQIWLAGQLSAHALLVRLAPSDLHEIGASALEYEFGTAARIRAAGTDSLLVDEGQQVHRVWCIRGPDGSVGKWWDIAPWSATSTRGAAYAVVGTQLVRLDIAGTGCTWVSPAEPGYRPGVRPWMRSGRPRFQ